MSKENFTRSWLAITIAIAASGCSGTEVGYPRYIIVVESSGAGGTGDLTGSGAAGGVPAATGGGTSQTQMAETGAASGSPQGMGTTGGSAGTGGAEPPPAGAGGGETGGTPGDGGTTNVTVSWPEAYDAAGAPEPADGHHNTGSSCMSSVCHGETVPFAFGGTVYQADGTTAAPHVQVGISDGAVVVTAYSADNGNIWLPATAGTIDWANAAIVIRSQNGERVKPASAPRGSACNASGCHSSSNRLLEP